MVSSCCIESANEIVQCSKQPASFVLTLEKPVHSQPFEKPNFTRTYIIFGIVFALIFLSLCICVIRYRPRFDAEGHQYYPQDIEMQNF